MIAFYHGAIQFADALYAFVRIGVIADHVAQAHKVGASTLPRVRQDCFERFEVRVNITEDCKTHLQHELNLKELQRYNGMHGRRNNLTPERRREWRFNSESLRERAI